MCCGLDTVVALNVIEHIAEDVAALRSMRDMLVPGGRAVVLVPALPWLTARSTASWAMPAGIRAASCATHMEEAGPQDRASLLFQPRRHAGLVRERPRPPVPRIPLHQLRYFDALVPLLRVEDAVPLPLRAVPHRRRRS